MTTFLPIKDCIAVRRHHEHSNPYKRKHLIGWLMILGAEGIKSEFWQISLSTLCVLGTKLRLSGLAASTLINESISPAPKIKYIQCTKLT